MNSQNASVKPLSVLQEFLANCGDRFRILRFFGPAFRMTVAQEIAAEVVTHQNKLASDSTEAQRHDQTAEEKAEEALSELRACTIDGALNEEDRPRFNRAVAKLTEARSEIRQSKIMDHSLANALRA
jgi:hypothetical protein